MQKTVCTRDQRLCLLPFWHVYITKVLQIPTECLSFLARMAKKEKKGHEKRKHGTIHQQPRATRVARGDAAIERKHTPHNVLKLHMVPQLLGTPQKRKTGGKKDARQHCIGNGWWSSPLHKEPITLLDSVFLFLRLFIGLSVCLRMEDVMMTNNHVRLFFGWSDAFVSHCRHKEEPRHRGRGEEAECWGVWGGGGSSASHLAHLIVLSDLTVVPLGLGLPLALPLRLPLAAVGGVGGVLVGVWVLGLVLHLGVGVGLLLGSPPLQSAWQEGSRSER